jgi:hypothetical protein
MKWCSDWNSDTKGWAPLALKVKMDGARWYRFGLACGQSVNKIVSADTGCIQYGGMNSDRGYYY